MELRKRSEKVKFIQKLAPAMELTAILKCLNITVNAIAM
jgi:hypothetical protein